MHTRLLIPLSLYITQCSGKSVEIAGHGSILKRDLSESLSAVRAAGAAIEPKSGRGAYLPLEVSGGVSVREITFSGSESSQIVSGFLMLLPLLEQDTTLTITNPASIPYIELTLRVLKQFGVEISEHERTKERISWYVRGGQTYRSGEIYLDADWSSAAFFAVGGAIKGEITLKEMPLESLQADEAILDILKQCGVEIEYNHLENSTTDVKIVRNGELKPFSCDATHSPDLFPVLALLGSYAEGQSIV